MVLAVEVEKDALRAKTLDAAMSHKASWIELGQFLYTIHKDKLFKTWGFLSFETYCGKELGIKQTTAAKLLKSYAFLEQEEPRLTKPEYSEEQAPRDVPNYESVNLLRLAKENKSIEPREFADLRESVLMKAKEPKEVRAQVQKILEEKKPKDPAAEKRARRNTAVKRLITTLSSTKRELQSEGLLPDYLAKQMDELMSKLEDQIED